MHQHVLKLKCHVRARAKEDFERETRQPLQKKVGMLPQLGKDYSKAVVRLP